MNRVVLTDKLVAALRPGDRRFHVLDALVPGLLVSVNPGGAVTFMLRTRIGSGYPVRRAIGNRGHVTVEQARRTAREWIELLHTGGSPEEARREARAAEREARAAAEAAASATVGAVFDQFAQSRQLQAQRRGGVVTRIIRNELLPDLGDRPIGEVTHREVRAVIERIIARVQQRHARNGTGGDGPRGSAYAHGVLDAARALFGYAVDVLDVIEFNSCDRLARKRASVIGPKYSRARTLTDNELQALWKAATRLGYPWGAFYKLRVLTGTRLNEAAGARWSEFDFDKNLWTIPAARAKSNRPHEVPLTPAMLELLATLPRFKRGDHLFSFDFGVNAVAAFSVGKRRLDRLMLSYLRAQARMRGDDPAAVKLEPFVNHDLRRVVRSGLAKLKVQDHVAELCLGHARKGLAGVYDMHQYENEKREALERWAALLHSLVSPPPPTDNVVRLREAR